MVSSTSVSEGLTVFQDKGLHLRLTDGARDLGLVDASIYWSGATVPGLTLSKPMRPPPLHVSVTQEEDHSHPLKLQ